MNTSPPGFTPVDIVRPVPGFKLAGRQPVHQIKMTVDMRPNDASSQEAAHAITSAKYGGQPCCASQISSASAERMQYALLLTYTCQRLASVMDEDVA